MTIGDTKLLSDVISGTVSGIVSGAFLALSLFIANRARNWALERKLRKGFGRCGTGVGDGYLTLIVENRLPVAVRVRTAFLAGAKGQGGLELKYMRPVSNAALFNALGQASSPNRIAVSAHFAAEPEGESGITLAGFSGGLWGVSDQDVRREPWSIQDAWMILEYPTLLGGAAFIRVHLDQPTLGLVRRAIADVRGEPTN
jgi:hypothetical protein